MEPSPPPSLSQMECPTGCSPEACQWDDPNADSDLFAQQGSLEAKLAWHRGGKWKPLECNPGKARYLMMPNEFRLVGRVPNESAATHIGSCLEKLKGQAIQPIQLHEMLGARMGYVYGARYTI